MQGARKQQRLLRSGQAAHHTSTVFPAPTLSALRRMAALRNVSQSYLVVEYVNDGLAKDSARIDELIEDW